MSGTEGITRPDPRRHAYRPDLADERLRGVVASPRYVAGREARVIGGIVPVRHEPDPGAELVTHYHCGERALVFDDADGWLWCQSLFDGYVGYVEARHAAIGPPPEATHVVATLGSYRYEAPDLRGVPVDFLPRHSAVTVVESGLMTRGTDYARLDGGGFLPLACLSRQPPGSPDLAAAAALYLGCPYLWGGRSFFGIDCSGLVQAAFRDLGVTVPRDTDMQRDTIGERLPAADPAELRSGDLLYLPGHVLIHEGDGAVIHADGASMTVRRDDLRAWLRARGLALGELTVRRP